MYLGIDPGSHCGWAVMDKSLVVKAHGHWDLKGGRFEGGGMRYVRFRKYLTTLLDAYPEIKMVGFEEVRMHMGVDAAHVYGGIVANLTEVLETRKIPYAGIPVGTVKKRATGKGNANKLAMVAAATTEWPALGALTEDEADALWIAVCATELS